MASLSSATSGSGASRQARCAQLRAAVVHRQQQLCGAMHVRVRRDADDQAVLARLTQQLRPLVPPERLCIQVRSPARARALNALQIAKDDAWMLPNSPQIRF